MNVEAIAIPIALGLLWLIFWMQERMDQSIERDMREKTRWDMDCEEFDVYTGIRQHIEGCHVPKERPYPINCGCKP